MNKETKIRYEKLKKINNNKIKEKKMRNNKLLMECLEALGDISIIDDEELQNLINIIMVNFEFYGSGHLQAKQENVDDTLIKINNIEKYLDINEYYYIIWSNPELPSVKCRLKSIIENFDDVDAVDFGCILMSENYGYILETTYDECVRIFRNR